MAFYCDKARMKSIIIANITWNPDGWRNTYVNRHAGHRYVREAPGHESLNFKFDKPIDKNGKVHGYVQWTYPPKGFQSGGIIVFYSRNLKSGEGEIVGIYGDVEVLRKPISTHYFGFEENTLQANIIAKESFSMLFPIPLNEKKYKKMLDTKRLVPQVGFRWVEDVSIIKHIILDEIEALKRSEIGQDELKKLVSIFEHTTGEVFKDGLGIDDEDIKEQNEIIDVLQKRDRKDEIIQDLKNLKPTEPELIKFEGKTYKRDNKTIAELKIMRDFKCQICDKQILKKNGGFYIEASHITPKSKKGLETPDNILILCPNHHKEFDLGNKEITKHTADIIEFKLNGSVYSLKLSF